jgi:hypothetical protein
VRRFSVPDLHECPIRKIVLPTIVLPKIVRAVNDGSLPKVLESEKRFA